MLLFVLLLLLIELDVRELVGGKFCSDDTQLNELVELNHYYSLDSYFPPSWHVYNSQWYNCTQQIDCILLASASINFLYFRFLLSVT